MTGTISSAGIGSGLDVSSLITKLMAVESQPLTALTTKETGLQAKLSTLGTIKSALATLQTAAKALSTPAQLSPTKASVADATILSASVASTAATGTYNIEVQSLADSQKLITAGVANTTDAIGTVGKTITFNFGTFTGSSPTATFAPNTAKTAQTITIDSSNNSLAGLRDAINAANMGVTASIINDGSPTNPYHLTFTSTDTGARNAMQISVDDASLNAFTYDPTGGTSNLTQTVSAKDAVIKIDSTTITKQSNSISDAIEGVTLNLTKESAPGVTTKLALTHDTSGMQTAIQNFVNAYNGATKAMVDATAYSTTTGAATLTGDSTIRMVQSQLRTLMTTSITGAPSGSSVLSDVGISFQRDGSVAIDAAKLSSAMSDTTKDFTALFASKGANKGYALQMDVLIGQINSPVGSLANHTKSINSSITDIGKQRTVLNARLAVIEKQYRAKFSALDTLIASMNTTSNYLSQQLTSIQSMTNGINSGK